MNRRILHVLRRFEPGGVELWLLDLLRSGGVPGCRLEFLTTLDGRYDGEVRQAGGVLHRWDGSIASIRETLEKLGPFDAVHSHVHRFSGFILDAARHVGTPLRIAHSHCQQPERWWWRRVYGGVMRRILATGATLRLAVSRAAAVDLFGTTDGVTIAPAARDLRRYAHPSDRGSARARFGLSDDCIAVAHAGRLVPEKNQRLLLDIASRHPRIRILLAGDGPLRNSLRHPQAIHLGHVEDLASVFAAADCFALPSRSEGLGLSLVEAQAAGLPCVVSDRVPEEAIVERGRVERVGLGSPAAHWTAALLRACERGFDSGAWRRLLLSPFHIERSRELLEAVYDGR
ncbi:MAG: glycosyltransferase [Bryobacteraceae bacterium]|nr:glycosyltransferase [Bryobacteraceae bacterium]